MLNPKVDIPLFATNDNPLQLYHSRKAKIVSLRTTGCSNGFRF